jgi:hypothetical protein
LNLSNRLTLILVFQPVHLQLLQIVELHGLVLETGDLNATNPTSASNFSIWIWCSWSLILR